MFSFLKKKSTVGIQSVQLPDLEWEKAEESSSVIKWISPNKQAVTSLHYIKLAPDLPTIKNVDELRDLYRNQLGEKGGLIQVDIATVQNKPAVKTILKIFPEPNRLVYTASLTIPFESCSFVVSVQAVEVGITGIRETTVTSKLLKAGELTVVDNSIKNWFKDPYNPEQTKGFLMNVAEDEKYDTDFPEHPLTLIRNLISKIENEIILKPELDELNPFDK
ncbi:hypothetical protein GCM10007424_18380 [Flavobacterium suaedae]|uniref:Uncharacterized protein n=1 Tax=Flavobacterium suaedae TaxID=1767027 RepID=A0ABQ1JZ03_9FLAO|nr:hypothetical protein [Flavobacterium suaedae]GGB78557.1 hypothetical protein GCM10007424_18380 [Flavobacterium suaedae]